MVQRNCRCSRSSLPIDCTCSNSECIAIWFVAWQSAALLSFAGGAKVTLGDTFANPANGQSVNWNDWEGNRWFLTEEMSEYSFHTELLVNGEPIYINFVLACTAIQSMIIFVGAISVLDIDWRKRVRALFVALSLIHILNLFQKCRPDLASNGLSRLEMDESFNLRIWSRICSKIRISRGNVPIGACTVRDVTSNAQKCVGFDEAIGC